MDKRKLGTKAACRVANIDRVRLSDIIASGDYSAAPKTSPGKERLFDERDLIALYLFAQFDQTGYPARLAGRIVNDIRDALEYEPDAEFVTIKHNFPDRGYVVPGADFDPEMTHLSGLPFMFTTIFDLRNWRAMVRHLLDEEFNTKHDD